MTTATLPPELRLLAPIFAARFRALIVQLIGFIALRLGRHPRLASLTPKFCNRLNRATRIIAAAMARLATGRRATGRAPRIDPRRNRVRPPRQTLPLPTAPGWLLRELKHEAALTRSHLETLLAEPGMAELLAYAPSIQRLLNPIRRALGIGHTPRAKPPAPPPAPIPPAQPKPARQTRFVHFTRIL